MKRTKLLIGLLLALVLVLSVTLMACAGGGKGTETGNIQAVGIRYREADDKAVGDRHG